MSIFQRLLLLVGIFGLAACEQPLPPTPGMIANQRPIDSAVTADSPGKNPRNKGFERDSSDVPTRLTTVYYTDRDGLSLGISGVNLADGVEMTIRDEYGYEMNTDLAMGKGDNQIAYGKAGTRYQLEVSNTSPVAYELVATVDGVDVISGRPGSVAYRGYLIYPGETLVINGFYKNEREVAAFRFASVPDPDAAEAHRGKYENAGVIRLAMFAERGAQTIQPAPAG